MKSATKNRSRQEKPESLPDFRRHMQHSAAVGEIHSRPFPDFTANRVIIHYAFMSEGGTSVANAVLAELCKRRGQPIPASDIRYHQIAWNNGTLRWEGHSEFSTFTFDAPAPRTFMGMVDNHPFGSGFAPPGAVIAASRLEIRSLNQTNRKLLKKFDQESLTVTVLEDGKSLLATDFRQDVDGLTVFLLLEADLSHALIGSYAKTVLELDTYRTLTMLGLPLARSLSGKLGNMEVELSRLTSAMKEASPDKSEELLSKINNIAAELESDAAASLFRFGASRAYGSIVSDRIATLGNLAEPGYLAIGSYLNRSVPPALRTCASVEDRQENLSRKLARIANLLRTRVEIEIESQNRNLLDSMNKRTQMQLRLQQTVEGLSVAAVSYYVVGLFYYLAQAAEPLLPFGISPKAAAGIAVPIVILGIWMLVRRIRKRTVD
jgi:uncharacterized membrane-anchored protein